MVKINVHDGETPTDSLIREAQAEYVVNDAKGRRITLRKPSPLAQFKLVKMLGDAAQNQAYVGMVFPLLFVTDIEGEPVHFPISEREIEATIMRLDDQGLAAVMNGVQEHFGAADQGAAAEAVKP